MSNIVVSPETSLLNLFCAVSVICFGGGYFCFMALIFSFSVGDFSCARVVIF